MGAAALDRAGTRILHLMVNLWDVTTRPVCRVYPNRLKTRPISSHMLLITAPEEGTRMVSHGLLLTRHLAKFRTPPHQIASLGR